MTILNIGYLSHFESVLISYILSILTITIVTASGFFLFKSTKRKLPIDWRLLKMTSFGAFLLSFPIIIVLLFDNYDGFIALIVLFNVIGGILAFYLLNKLDGFKDLILSKKSKIVMIIIILSILPISKYIDFKKTEQFSTDNIDLSLIKEEYEILKEDIWNYYTTTDFDGKTLKVAIVDSSFYNNIIFVCDIEIENGKIKNPNQFISKQHYYKNLIQKIDFLKEFVEDNDSNKIFIFHYDSTLHKEKLFREVFQMTTNDELEQLQLWEYINLFDNFFSEKISQSDSISLNNELKKITDNIDSLMYFKTYKENQMLNSWIVLNEKNIYLLRDRHEYYFYDNFNKSFNNIRPDKFIQFDKQGKIIDNNFR